jgi:hypothetical protein
LRFSNKLVLGFSLKTVEVNKALAITGRIVRLIIPAFLKTTLFKTKSRMEVMAKRGKGAPTFSSPASGSSETK